MLIDAYAQIFRGYYAIRYLSNSQGIPTNAVFAMAKFMLRLESSYPSDLGAFVLDCGKPDFRLEIAPDYKANRPPTPEDLKAQVPLIKELVEAFGWPIFLKQGFEADDIIADIAVRFKNFKVNIISGDKDLAQLIDDRVVMLVPDHKGGGLEIRDKGKVLEKFSVSPEQIIDYLALIGDSSDNIPGVSGVGPKTAAKLIQQFGSIDELIARSNEIDNEKLRLKIADAKELLKKNQDLIRLATDIPEGEWQNLEAIKRNPPDWNKIREIAERLELKSIVKEIDEIAPKTNDPSPELIIADDKKDEESDSYIPDMFGDF
jgi:DNA polymerase-1